MLKSQDDSVPRGGLRVTYEISLGAILQSLVVLAVGGLLYVVNASNKGDNTASNLTRVEGSVSALRTEILQQIGDFKTANKDQFDELKHQVAGLPDQTADMRQLRARIDALEQAKKDRDQAMGTLHDQVLLDHSALTAIQEANHPLLGVKGKCGNSSAC